MRKTPKTEREWFEVRGYLEGVLAGRVPEADDRKDVVPVCMIRAWRRAHTFDGRAAFTIWLYRTAAYRVLKSLPDVDRRILTLRHFCGGVSAEIGAEVRLAPSSVRCRIRQCRRLPGDGPVMGVRTAREPASARERE